MKIFIAVFIESHQSHVSAGGAPITTISFFSYEYIGKSSGETRKIPPPTVTKYHSSLLLIGAGPNQYVGTVWRARSNHVGHSWAKDKVESKSPL